MSIINLESLREAPLVESPFPHFMVEQCLNTDCLAALRDGFPKIERGGSFPLDSLDYDASFDELTRELRGNDVRQIFEQKFDIDLSDRPTTLTVRGQTRSKDGRIHTDSKTKLITVLLYLNSYWNSEGGQLRLLRSPNDIEDVITEITPSEGMFVAFRCTDNAWHGHKQFVGERRSIQLNWVVDQGAAKGSRRRHRMSALLKSFSAKKKTA